MRRPVRKDPQPERANKRRMNQETRALLSDGPEPTLTSLSSFGS